LGSHIAITSHINAKQRPQTILPQDVFNAYVYLENISKVARYDGVGPNLQAWQLDRRIDYQNARDILEVLRTAIATDILQVRNNPVLP